MSPVPQPQTPTLPRAPEVVPHHPGRSRFRWGWLAVLVVLGAAGWWYWSQRAEQAATKSTATVAIRTTSVSQGTVRSTLRLTGTTGAEKYASLLVPQLRGGRSESLREGRSFSGPGANYTVQSNAGRSGGGGSTASTGGSSGGSVQSTAESGGGGGSAAMRSSTSRVSRGGASTGGGNVRSSGSSSSGGGLGSTAGALIGSGGGGGGGGGGMSGGGGGGGGGGFRGGGGGGDYMLVLQEGAKSGVTVKAGTTVAEFDRQYILTRLEDYRASVAQMEASFIKLKAELEVQKKSHNLTIENAKAALDKARLDLKRLPVEGRIFAEQLKLAEEEAAARYKQLLNEVKLVDARATAQAREAEMQLRQARLELKRAEANADRMILKAPLDGLVVYQTTVRGTEISQIQVGDQLYPGMRFMQIVDPSSMVITASVNQVDAETLRVGAKASVQFDAFPGLQLPAHVHAIGAMTKQGGQRAAFVKEIPVLLKLDKMDPRVIPDLSVSVDVEIGKEEQSAAVVPLGAVFQDASNDGKPAPYVFVRNGATWERRPVELGLSSNLVVAVRSGLRAGEVVALDYPPVEVHSKGQG